MTHNDTYDVVSHADQMRAEIALDVKRSKYRTQRERHWTIGQRGRDLRVARGLATDKDLSAIQHEQRGEDYKKYRAEQRKLGL